MTSMILLILLVAVVTGSCYVIDNSNDPDVNGMICTEEPVDLALVLDVSSSMRPGRAPWAKWDEMKKFVKQYLGYYDISEKGTHVAITTYGDDAQVDINFDQGTNAAILNKKITDLRQGVNTYMDKGLKVTYEQVFTKDNPYMRPKNVKKVLVLFTDGYQTEYPPFTPPEKEAQILKDRGVLIYTVGVGEKVDEKQLQKIATKDSYYFYAKTFDDLKSVAEKMVNKQCKPKTAPPSAPSPIEEVCTVPVDLMLILDRSGSITYYWPDVKRFAKAVTDQFAISKDGTHVAIITFAGRFSEDTIVEMSFDDYKRAQITNADVKDAIDILKPPKTGRTYINLAFDKANDLFTEKMGMRADVKKLCILLTDGRQTHSDKIDPSENAQKLKDKGVTVLAFGFGDKAAVDEAQLQKIASSETLATRSKDFEVLINTVKKVSREKCQT